MRRRVRETPAARYLLDTHVVLWTLQAPEVHLSTSVADVVAPGRVGVESYLSDVTFWEVALKAAKGRLRLEPDLPSWLARAASLPGVRFLPADREILIMSARLPDAPPTDPIDCILIATALAHGLTLVTADRTILAYARRHASLKVLDARA